MDLFATPGTIISFVINCLEFIAFCLVVYKSKLIYRSSLRLLLLVLPFIFLTETYNLVKMYVVRGNSTHQEGNINFYNITTLITFLLYYLLYLENVRIKFTRKVFLISCLVTLAFYIINRSFIQTGPTSFHTYSFTICSLCLCLGIIFYIKEIVESEKIVLISKDPLFWISIGLFVFYIINIPFWGMYNYLLGNYIDFLETMIYLTMGLNIIMYCCIILGLLWVRK